MEKILKYIKNFQLWQNIIEIATLIAFSALILLIFVQTYTIIYLLFPQSIYLHYQIGLILKLLWITLSIWLGTRFEKRFISPFQAAQQIDSTNQLTDDNLANAYEFITNTPAGNRLIIEKYIENISGQIDTLTPRYDKGLFQKSLMYLMVVLIALSTQALVIGSGAWSTYIHFFRNNKPQQILMQHIILHPGDITVSKGEILSITVQNPLEKAEYTLFYGSGEFWRQASPHHDGNQHVASQASWILNTSQSFLDSSFYYYVTNQWASSDTFLVVVLEDPSIRKISLKYFYPDYINRRPDFIENSDGFMTVPQFTEIEMTIETTESVKEANIVFSDGAFQRMTSEGKAHWTTRFSPTESIGYHLSLTDQLDNTNSVVSRNINVIPDQHPMISFTYPARDTMMTQNNLFEVRLVASDDYGLRNLRIFYQINQNPMRDTLLIRSASGNFVTLSHTFDFSRTPLFPGDEVEYFAEVFDNSPLHQKATTPRFKLRFPSIEEIYRDLERQEEERSNTLSQAHQEIQEMQREFDLKRREMLRKDEMDWDDQRALEKFINDQRALNEMVENVAENYQQVIDSLEKNEAISSEMLEKMQRIQEIMEQISNDDLKRAMERMQESIESMNPQEIRAAMENFQFNMADFAEKLDQTLQLLQAIKNEQNLEQALEIAKEMHKMQDDLLKKTEQASDVSGLSDEQQRLEDKLQALMQQTQKAIDDAQGSRDQNFRQDMQSIMDNLHNSDLSESLSESTDALQENRKSDAMKSQSQSLEQMSRMISRMQEMKDNMSSSGSQMMVEAVQTAIQRLLLIAREHRAKTDRIGNDPVPYMAAFISDFESLQLTINQLYLEPQILLALGQKFFADLNFTINAYRTFFTDIQNSRFNNHKNQTQDIQAGINLVIFNLMQALNNMGEGEGSGGGSGMQSLMQSLKQMSAQQMMMNTITQGMLEQMSTSGNRVTNQMRQQMQEMAAEEQRLADNLKRLMQTNPEAQRHTNALQEMVSELEDIANRLRQNRVDQNLVDRQNRIMSRLLEIQRSINRRDNSNQRRGETATENLWDLPPDIDLHFQNANDRKALEETLRLLPIEYRQMILEYLRMINTQ
jgi:hypothetical protein